MLVIVLELVCDLSPYLAELIVDTLLVSLVYKQPAAVNGIVAVAVDIDNSVHIVFNNVVNYLLNSAEPGFVDSIIWAFSDLGKIGYGYSY